MAGIRSVLHCVTPSWGFLVVRGPSSAILLTVFLRITVHLLFIEELNSLPYLISDRSPLGCSVNGWLRDTYSLRDGALREPLLD